MPRYRPAFAVGLVLLVLIGCSSGDSPSTAPPDPLAPEHAISCPDEPCGPTDGTIHDGTGNGSLPSFPGDPSPGAAGLWLGNMLSARWCYAEYNLFVTDRDNDWLDDECEYQLAKAFAPVLMMSPTDGCPKGEPYWSAKYVDQPPGTSWGEFVRIAYMPAYYKDCGRTPHAGDSEFLMIGIHQNTTTRHWQVREAYLSAHSGTANPGAEYVRTPTLLEYPLRSLAYPRIWIARGKHGHYRTKNECQTRALIPDDCGDNAVVGRLRIHRSRNTGSRFVDNFPSGVASTNPLYSQNGRREYFYTARNFAGWQPNVAGVTPYRTPIFSFRYECFDYSYNFGGGTCYFGPGPAAPTTRTLTGVIDGPTSVSTQQTYTWTSFVTGGQLPYRAEWWRRYASATAATLVGTSTGTYTGATSTAGSFAFKVDRCESFTLTIKIFDRDNRSWTDNHAVTIASCPPPPPPPLTVYINGPEHITVKGTYTYAAVVNSTGVSYSWSVRFCDDYAGTACTAWTTYTGLGASLNRVLGPECGPLKQDNFQVRVVASASGGRTATAMLQTGLCSGGGGPIP